MNRELFNAMRYEIRGLRMLTTMLFALLLAFIVCQSVWVATIKTHPTVVVEQNSYARGYQDALVRMSGGE